MTVTISFAAEDIDAIANLFQTFIDEMAVSNAISAEQRLRRDYFINRMEHRFELMRQKIKATERTEKPEMTTAERVIRRRQLHNEMGGIMENNDDIVGDDVFLGDIEPLDLETDGLLERNGVADRLFESLTKINSGMNEFYNVSSTIAKGLTNVLTPEMILKFTEFNENVISDDERKKEVNLILDKLKNTKCEQHSAIPIENRNGRTILQCSKCGDIMIVPYIIPAKNENTALCCICNSIVFNPQPITANNMQFFICNSKVCNLIFRSFSDNVCEGYTKDEGEIDGQSTEKKNIGNTGTDPDDRAEASETFEGDTEADFGGAGGEPEEGIERNKEAVGDNSEQI